jgi:predicted nucleic acid-binding protein
MAKIYLDNCCYNRPYDSQDKLSIRLETQAKLFIQQKVKDDEISLVWSFISSFENAENPSKEKRLAIGTWQEIANEYCGSAESILQRASTYGKLGLHNKDALHLACAVEMNCDYFITTDKKFINKGSQIKEIKIVNPTIFVLEVEAGNEK